MVDLYGIHVGKYTIAQMDPMRNKFMNMMKFAKNWDESLIGLLEMIKHVKMSKHSIGVLLETHEPSYDIYNIKQ